MLITLRLKRVKVLFFEICKDLKLVDSPVTPKPVYESPDAQAYWDVPNYQHSNLFNLLDTNNAYLC